MSQAAPLTTSSDSRCEEFRTYKWQQLTLGGAIGLIVVAPWIGNGYVLLLDWVRGPSLRADPNLYGLASPPTVFPALVELLQRIVGGTTISWLVIFAVFPIGCMTISSVVPTGRIGKAAAGLLFTVNPFVFERLAVGQVYVLLVYAITPAFLRLLCDEARARQFPLRSTVVLTVLTSVSVHAVWMCVVIYMSCVVVYRPGWRFLLGGLALVPLSLTYLWLPTASGDAIRVGVTDKDLHLFATSGDHTLGLFGNLLAMYGFWRPNGAELKYHSAGWPLLAITLLVVVGYGTLVGLRSRHRSLLAVALICGTLGFILALGAQGPGGGVFVLLFEHVPGFAVMREAEKFLALECLFFAISFGLGVEALTRASTAKAAQAASCSPLVVVVAYSSSLFWGLGGSVAASSYPADWYQARSILGNDNGAVLFLPWHLYQPFGFSGDRTVSTPASAFFKQSVISGDDLELDDVYSESTSPRSAYLESLLRQGPNLRSFGGLISSLGVCSVALSADADASSYSWLNEQSDLRLVLKGPTIALWRNISCGPDGTAAATLSTEPSAAAYVADVEGHAISPSAPVALGSARHLTVSSGSPLAGAAVGPTSFSVRSDDRWVTTPIPSEAGWSASHGPTLRSPTGVTITSAQAGHASVHFAPWRRVLLGYAISGAAVLFCAVRGWLGRGKHRYGLTGRAKQSRRTIDRHRRGEPAFGG